jgi:thiamine biosynthesis lipoprotein
MGTNVHLVVVDGNPELLETAKARIEDLEQRWSRFLPDSELCQLNRGAGHDTRVDVSAITFDLIIDACDAWRETNGLFDPTILPALVAAGYDRSFDEGHGPSSNRHSSHAQAHTVDDIVIDDVTHTIVLPDDIALDLGGIGKGRAADLAIEELIDTGAAAGACINLGGDLRVFGAAPDNAPAWAVAIEQPLEPDDVLRVVGLADGALATSSTTKRRWQGDDGEVRHHLIDPRTHEPARTTVQSVSVIAGSAMHAEIHAKASLIAGEPTDGALPMLFVHDDGRQQMFSGFEAYVW